MTKIITGKNSGNIKQGGRVVSAVSQQKPNRVFQISREHRAHFVLGFSGKKFLENAAGFLNNKFLFFGVVGVKFQKIQTERTPDIRRVKINHVCHSFAGNISDNPLNNVALGVNNGHSFTLLYVSDGQINNRC